MSQKTRSARSILPRIALAVSLVLLAGPLCAATGTLAPQGKAQYFDDNGNPLSGGLLYTYIAGTTTNLATYSDQALTVANANPIVLDSAGRATIYLSAASYKFVLKTSAGVTVWTQDNIQANAPFNVATDITGTAGAAISAGDVVYLSDGSGGLTAGRWYQADADFTYASSQAGVIGIAPAAISSGLTGAIRLQGSITGLSGLVSGTTYYVSATAGALTSTAPANVRFVGVADSTTTLVVAPTLSSNIALLNAANTFTNTTGQSMKKVLLPGSTSGTLTVASPAVSGTTTVTLPAGPLTSFTCGRLTLTTATPVTTADVTAATTLYYTPYGCNLISLYDGSATWNVYAFTELSIAVPATTSTMYDVWVYDNAGTPALEVLAWTNDTTRATALTTQNGVYVKTGATTRRYVGSFRTTGVSGQTEDSFANRLVYNYYNQKDRIAKVSMAGSWTYASATIREANGSTANQVNFVQGVNEQPVQATYAGLFIQGAASGEFRYGLALDSVTAFSSAAHIGGRIDVDSTSSARPAASFFRGYSGVGYHYLAALEASDGTHTVSIYGAQDTGSASGILAVIQG